MLSYRVATGKSSRDDLTAAGVPSVVADLTDPDHIAYEVTVDDPKMYTKPWKNSRTLWRLKPGEELLEYSCEENNRDLTQGHIK